MVDSLLLVGRLSGWFFVWLVGCLVGFRLLIVCLVVLWVGLVGQCLDNCALAVLLASDEDQRGRSFDINHLLLYLLSSHQAQLSAMLTLNWFYQEQMDSRCQFILIIIAVFIILSFQPAWPRVDRRA